MIATLLLTLAAGTGSAAAAPAQDPPIRIWMSNDRRFEQGDRAKVQVETQDDGYVVVLNADPDGHVRVLFPLDPGDDNFVRGGHRYEIRGRGNREAFSIDVASGRGAVYAAVSRDPMRFDQYMQGDHWDYRALNDVRLGDDPEPDLTDLVGRLATGRFEYDIASYDVSYGRTVSYYGPSTAYYAPVRSTYYDPFCDFYSQCDPYYYTGRSGLSVGLTFGRRYDPFYYDPFYYDPYYYGGSYRPSRYPGYYPRGYGYGYNDGRSTYRGQIYTPYQFKSIDRTWGGSGVSPRATHTVYGPPIGTGAREGAPSRPGVDGSPRVAPGSGARQDAADYRGRRVEASRPAQDRPQDERQARQNNARPEPSAAPAPSRDDGRQASPREEQRSRQAERARRYEAVPSPQIDRSREVKPAPYQPRIDRSSRPVREAPRVQSAPPPREAPRMQAAPRENRSYARPSESARSRRR